MSDWITPDLRIVFWRHTLTVYVVWSKGDFNLKCFVGVLDGGKLEVGQGLLAEIRHHSLCKNNTKTPASGRHLDETAHPVSRHAMEDGFLCSCAHITYLDS